MSFKGGEALHFQESLLLHEHAYVHVSGHRTTSIGRFTSAREGSPPLGPFFTLRARKVDLRSSSVGTCASIEQFRIL